LAERTHPLGLPAANQGRMRSDDFHELCIRELKDLYGAERRLVWALLESANDEDLAVEVQSYIGQMKVHIAHLEKVLSAREGAALGNKNQN
jgi:ferritin-like metal-binding protein YciE